MAKPHERDWNEQPHNNDRLTFKYIKNPVPPPTAAEIKAAKSDFVASGKQITQLPDQPDPPPNCFYFGGLIGITPADLTDRRRNGVYFSQSPEYS
jgi:hypothetical protein